MESDKDYSSSNADETTHSEEEEERDANAEDQHSDDTAQEGEGDADAEGQASQPPRRPRRKRTVTRWPDDKIVVTELTEAGMPKEQKAQTRMRKLAGLIARQRISLVMSSFSVLSEEDKTNLFNECVQPWLEFAAKLKVMACKKMMQMVAKSWRTHKSDLVRYFVRKGLDARVKHPYILQQVWADFVTLKQGEDAKKESARFKKLRERNKHDHCLGTGGYAGKEAQWEQEDRELAAEGIPNPWDQFPGRSRSFMRAQSKLVKSEGKVVIVWASQEAESLAQATVKKQAEIESSGVTLVRDKDVLTQALGQPEQTGRMRGLSSYTGWKFWLDCTSMYRKRKRSNDVDVEAIKEQVALEVTEKVTNDIMAMLRAQGVHLSSPSNTPPSADGKNSSCASASDAVCNVQLDRIGGISDLEVTGHTSCTLVLINPGGYQVEVATGRVFPNQTSLYSVPVQEGYDTVHIDFVYPEHEGHVLIPHPSAEIRTLGDAMYKRVQWRREWIVVSPKVFSSPISSKPPTPGSSAKSNLNVRVAPNVSPSLDEKANDSTVRNCASKAHVGKKQPKLTKPPPAPLPAPRAAKSDTRLDQKVGVKQKQQEAQHTKSSKSAPAGPVWGRANLDFKFGQPMLPATAVEKAGPGCVALHAHYMKACAQNRNTPIIAMIKRQHFLHESETEQFPVGFEDLFDLFTLDALDMSILRCLMLCLIVEARDTSVPVGLLDPDALSIESMTRSRDFSVQYLEKGLRKHAKKEYVMFAYNSGDHWIAVIIIPKWQKVLYLDSIRGSKTDLSGLKSVIDEAFGKSQTKAKKKPKNVKLTHATKTACLQQPLNNTCGFYAAHNLMLVMRQTNLDNPEEFEVVSTPINLEDIREKIAMFIVSQIMEQNGEFHCHEDVSTNGDEG